VVLVTSGSSIFHPRHFHLFAVSLARAGLPTVVVGQASNRDQDPAGDIVVHTVRGLPGRAGRLIAAPVALWRAIGCNPGLIQINSLDLLPWAVIARRLFGVPIIYDSNEHYASYMLIKEWVPSPLRVPLSQIVGRLEPVVASRLDAVVVADPDTGSQFERVDEVHVVHNFPWRSFGAGAAPASGPVYDVVHHGSLPSYTRENLLRTASALEDAGVHAHWFLATRNYNSKRRDALEQELDKLGLRPRFSLEYDLPFSEMPELIASSKVGFIPLPDERKFRHNIPRKLFEFLVVGRPVVASDLPPIRRFVGDSDCCILVPPGDVTGYANGLAEFLRDPVAAQEAGAEGKRLVDEWMNADRELASYVELCSRLRAGSE